MERAKRTGPSRDRDWTGLDDAQEGGNTAQTKNMHPVAASPEGGKQRDRPPEGSNKRAGW